MDWLDIKLTDWLSSDWHVDLVNKNIGYRIGGLEIVLSDGLFLLLDGI